MALPPVIQVVQVNFGPMLDFQGQPLRGSTTFEPSTPIMAVDTGTPILNKRITIEWDADGVGTVILPASDSVGINVSGFTYRVSHRTFDSGTPAPTGGSILLPAAAPVVDLDLLVPTTATNGVVVDQPAVTSVAGLSGVVAAADLAGALGGLIGGSDTAVAALVADTASDTRAALGAAFGPLDQYQLMTYVNLGDSWADTLRSNYSPGASPPARLANRLGMSLVNRGASSRSMEDIANFLLGGAWAWTPRTKALVTLTSCHLNNIKYLGTTAAAQRGYTLAVRAVLSLLTADAVIASNTSAFTYSTGWTTEATQAYSGSPTGASTPALGTVISTGGVRFTTTTTGSYTLCAVTGPAVDVVLVARAAGAGVCTVTDNSTGTVLGTIDLSATVAQETPAVLKLSGLGSGTRTLKITHTSGASLTIDSVRIPSTNPVPVVAVPAPDVPVDATNSLPAGDPAPSYNAAQATYRGLFAAVAAEYPTVTICDLTAAGFDLADFYTDKRHLNDAGSAKWAAAVRAHLITRGFSTGLNTLDVADPAAYVPPSAPAIPSGGQDGTGWDGTVFDIAASASYYWDADDLTNGAAVASWADRKTAAALTQATGGSQPTVTTVSGQKVVAFDGVDDYLTNTAISRPTVETEVIVFRMTAAPTSQRRYFASIAQTASELRTAGASSALTSYVMSDGTALTLTPNVAPDTAWHVGIFQRNGASSVIRIDGAETTGNTSSGSPTYAGLRQASSAGVPLNGATPMQIKRHYLIPAALNATQRAQVVAAMKAALPTLLA